MTFCDELRDLAREPVTAGVAAAVMRERHPNLSPSWVGISVNHYLNEWCRKGTCERRQQVGQPTVFQMRKL